MQVIVSPTTLPPPSLNQLVNVYLASTECSGPELRILEFPPSAYNLAEMDIHQIMAPIIVRKYGSALKKVWGCVRYRHSRMWLATAVWLVLTQMS